MESTASKQSDPVGLTLGPKIRDDTYDFIDPKRWEATNLSVLVTGASKGVGRATAKAFAQSGANEIAILARSNLQDVKQEITKAAVAAGRQAPKVLTLKADVSNTTEVDSALQKVREEFGSLDIVINNASRLEDWKSLAESDPEDWWCTWEANLKGTYLVTRASLPLLLLGEQKTVVNVTSAGALVASAGASAYQGTKAAQIKLNSHLMSEYGDQGLIAFAVHPGSIATETALNMPEDFHYMLTQTEELAGDTLVWLTRERRSWLADRYVFGPFDMQEFLEQKDRIVREDLLKLRLTI